MVSHETIKQNLGNCLNDTSYLNATGITFKKGKVRDTFDLNDRLVLITTDRQSAFDRILAEVPFKGQVLNQVSAFWFEKTSHIVKNHVLEIPDPNVTIGKKCTVFPIEFVMRGYLTGSTDTSAWTLYSKGSRNICGNVLPDGMTKNMKFNKPILTPTTKSDAHDESISAEEIVKRGIIDKKTWDKLSDIVFGLFEYGAKCAAEHGLILVDTKYELGTDADGNIVLIDEIHTPDSSRYWIAGSYQEHIKNGQEPENIDKEFLRLWFKDHCDPYKDEVLPKAPEELIVELSSRYIRLYEMITGKDFVIENHYPTKMRLFRNLRGIIV